MVDVSDVPDVVLGAEAVLIGQQREAMVTAYEVAQASGSVYRLLTGVPSTVLRTWV